VREFADACRRQDMKFGIYCSPWDRNNKEYGKPGYVETYRTQWRELLTNYGDLFELWVDGANGGSGWYGGAKERRNIDRSTYYGWDTNFALMKKLQPGAVIFSDVGPDLRWVGNERGLAGDPCWSTITYPKVDGKRPGPGSRIPKNILAGGVRNGSQWTPAEADVSTRPGWYYHPKQNKKVRSAENLIDLYFSSIGRGASLNLGLAPDTRGQLHANDVASLKKFGEWQKATFSGNAASDAKISADSTRDGRDFEPHNMVDGSRKTYWAADDGVTNVAVVLDFGKEQEFNVISIREYLPLGQRIDEWALDALDGDSWVEFAKGRAVGSRRLVRTDYITSRKLRLRLTNAAACPAISEVGVYREPDWARPGGVKLDLHSLVLANRLKDLKFGMFICWSFSTFSGREWTPTQNKDASFFKATGCDTDQWCKTAKDAGMGYILFLVKHHDGFCLWDTATTDKKVTNSPLGIDVLAKLRKSCDKYGIKLAIYFSEGDWNWPGAKDGRGGNGGGSNPEVKKAQLKELLTNYGPITFWWMDHAVGNGGLSHEDTVKWIHKFQPDCFVGFNHGAPAGRLALRERGRPGPIGGKNLRTHGKGMESQGHNYLVAEFTYPILPGHKGGAQWFYSLPKYDNLCHPADKMYRDYCGAAKYGNIFSLDVGPNYAGRIRDIDVETLKKVGQYIRGEAFCFRGDADAAASGVWGNDKQFGADKAFDSDLNTRWGAEKGSRKGWIEISLPKATKVSAVKITEGNWNRIKSYELQAEVDDKLVTVASGGRIGNSLTIEIKPLITKRVRFVIKDASDVPTIPEIEIQ